MKKILKIKVLPRSSKNEIVGEMADGILKIKLKAPPVEGEANNALIEFLAKEWEISKNKINIVSGKTGRRKTISIEE